MMLFSVYNYGTRMYDYYQSGGSPSGTHAKTPGRAMFPNKLGATPEQAAASLPIGAQKIGSGSAARGAIASLGDVTASSLGNVVLVGVIAYAAWRYFR